MTDPDREASIRLRQAQAKRKALVEERNRMTKEIEAAELRQKMSQAKIRSDIPSDWIRRSRQFKGKPVEEIGVDDLKAWGERYEVLEPEATPRRDVPTRVGSPPVIGGGIALPKPKPDPLLRGGRFVPGRGDR